MSRYLLTDPSHHLTCLGFPSKVSGALILISALGVVVVAAVGLDIGGVCRSGGGLGGIRVDTIARDAKVLAVNSDLWSGSSKSSDDESYSSALSDGGEGGIGSGEGGLLTLTLSATLDDGLW
jgi:hypothetical protein